MDIGNKIKKYRDINNMSQEELADKIFVSRQTISNWETNKSYPDIKSISMLSNIFGVTLDDFIKEDIKEMKESVQKTNVKKFTILSWIYTLELIILILSAYPLAKYFRVVGCLIWILFAIITLVTAIVIEKIKEYYNIQTYKEIIAFCDNRTLTYDEKNIEFGKRPYQKFILGICSGLIAIIVMIIMNLILR